jgi:hypothetical protein
MQRKISPQSIFFKEKVEKYTYRLTGQSTAINSNETSKNTFNFNTI